MTNKNLNIIDNSTVEQSVQRYLSEWCSISKQVDIATGYWEIGGLLSLDTDWQKLDKVRIILGNEVTNRTKSVIDAFVEATLKHIKDSVDSEHENNEFLTGVPAILAAMKSGKIECRVYDKGKFHAKAYITYFKDEYKNQFIKSMNIPEGYALVGSSNFTRAGMTQNIELNIQLKEDIDELKEWYEEHWKNSLDITEAVLEVIEKHCQEYSPYDVYLRSMYEFFKNQESVSEWEKEDSIIYKELAQYQRDGYNSLIQIADRYSGAFMCDGVGLGKTFIGMMLIERFVKRERKNVVLIVPAASRIPVWETTIKQFIPEILEGFYPFKIINHTDLLLEKNQNLLRQIALQGEIIIIDEAHHFRNRSSKRYRKLFEIMKEGPQKQMFMLTATPINNSFLDLQHLIELFTHRQDDFFSSTPLGIPSLTGHFKKMEAKLKIATENTISDSVDISDEVFKEDSLVSELVVQRSRSYVKKSLTETESSNVLFPIRQSPTVANYSIRKSYGKLIDHFINSFYRKDKETGRIQPILALPVYSPYETEYFIGDKAKIDMMVSGRQQQIVNLIRMLLLKRFESSIAAFEETCIRIYIRLLKFIREYQDYGNKRLIERLINKQAKIIEYVNQYIESTMNITIEDMEDDLPDYVWEVEDNLNLNDFNIEAMLDDTILDLEVLAEFIEDIMDINPESDDKIRELKRILTEEERLKNKKIIIFTEYRTTAQYIKRELEKAGFINLYEIDGQTEIDRYEIIQRFAPYYNNKTSKEINNEIQILIATDVLSEGLNLQDASCLINYELHWNPVRLMQRIGRVDRRRNKELEKSLLYDHPELKNDRENIYYWNFLPPRELEQLLALYNTVSQKALRISKTFGIEGKMLLTPEDDFEALKEFNSKYEGETTDEEEMVLAYQELLAKNPNYTDIVQSLPKKIYSGKFASNRKGIFFCYELPTKSIDGTWSNGEKINRWYFYDIESNNIIVHTYEIWKEIRCVEKESRVVTLTEKEFKKAKSIIDSFIKKNYLRAVQAPLRLKPRLVTWMQLV